jgi:molybdenum cofactor synthesis domain-containing protein
MKLNKIKIAVLPGDGIGIDVTHAALPIFNALNIPIELELGDIGWAYWINEGTPIPRRTWDLIHRSDATLLGAITSKPPREAQKELSPILQSKNVEYVSPVIQLRQQLHLYANVRPCKNIQNSVNNFDFCVIRENTEGLYAGFDYHPVPQSLKELLNTKTPWPLIDPEDCAVSLRVQSKIGLLRLFEFAFSYANKENLKRVTFADKPNVLRKSGDFSRKLFETVADKYPHIEAEILNVDAVSLWIVKRPEIFGVIVAENMFGDILSDLGAGVTGGLGFAPSANIGEKGCYFEPVHGSAPKVKPNCANPSAMFLTISLLLKHFSYKQESAAIVQAVTSVVKEGKHVTYDLGGLASTQDMSKAIIDACISPKKSKTIAIIVTGNELVHGDIQDKNANYFAHYLTEKGAYVKQQVLVPDDRNIIRSTLSYLLDNHDAVIISGGLGPTSDDLTRFALSDAIKRNLIFSENAYNYLAERLQRFGLKVVASNRQQALFPESAILIDNINGTAKGCYLSWNGRDIFMLPGPPKEAWPMFDDFVVSQLLKNNYFSPVYRKRFLTLGLIEGEIAPEIDKIAEKANVETGYRWAYPYLEIKLQADNAHQLLSIANEISEKIDQNIVSLDTLEDAVNCMNKTLKSQVYIIRNEYSENILHSWNNSYLTLSDSNFFSENSIIIKYTISAKDEMNNVLILHFSAFLNRNILYKHTLQIPNRGIEVKRYIEHYFAWQLCQFLKEQACIN